MARRLYVNCKLNYRSGLSGRPVDGRIHLNYLEVVLMEEAGRPQGRNPTARSLVFVCEGVRAHLGRASRKVRTSRKQCCVAFHYKSQPVFLPSFFRARVQRWYRSCRLCAPYWTSRNVREEFLILLSFLQWCEESRSLIEHYTPLKDAAVAPADGEERFAIRHELHARHMRGVPAVNLARRSGFVRGVLVQPHRARLVAHCDEVARRRAIHGIHLYAVPVACPRALDGPSERHTIRCPIRVLCGEIDRTRECKSSVSERSGGSGALSWCFTAKRRRSR